MSLVRALYGSVCSTFGMLLFAQADIISGSIRTTSSIDTTAIDSVYECMVAQIFIDRYLWALYARKKKIDAVKVPEQIKMTINLKGKSNIVNTPTPNIVLSDST